MLTVGDKIVEDELWQTERAISAPEAKELAEVAFHDYFDLVNYSVHRE